MNDDAMIPSLPRRQNGLTYNRILTSLPSINRSTSSLNKTLLRLTPQKHKRNQIDKVVLTTKDVKTFTQVTNNYKLLATRKFADTEAQERNKQTKQRIQMYTKGIVSNHVICLHA